jgi:hypothetical protein
MHDEMRVGSHFSKIHLKLHPNAARRVPTRAANGHPMTDSVRLAVDAIDRIYDQWMVDPDCALWVGDPSSMLRQGYGFDWWPGDFKVEVRVDGPQPDVEDPIYRLSVRTDFLCDVDIAAPTFKQIVSDLNRSASASAMCAHPAFLAESSEGVESLHGSGLDLRSSKVWLASTAYLHEGIKDWLPRVFSGLAVLQPVESQFRADHAASLLGGRPDRSRPPMRRSQTILDEMLGVEDWMLSPHGEEPSRWIGSGEFEKIIERWGRGDSGFGVADQAGLSMQTPFGDTSAIILLRTDRPHPRLGNGLYVSLSLPHVSDAETARAHAIDLNYLEDREWSETGVPFIGNWHADEWRGHGFVPEFSCFIPNMVYFPGLAENLALYAMARAKWGREILRPGAIDLPMHEILSRQLAAKEPQRNQADKIRRWFNRAVLRRRGQE